MQQLSLRTLIGGTIILLAPIVHNLISMAMIAHLLALDPKGDFHLNGALSNSYQGWCLFVGMCLLVVGIVSGFKAGRVANAQPLASLTPAPLAP